MKSAPFLGLAYSNMPLIPAVKGGVLNTSAGAFAVANIFIIGQGAIDANSIVVQHLVSLQDHTPQFKMHLQLCRYWCVYGIDRQWIGK
jgi:hypothetical protein